MGDWIIEPLAGDEDLDGIVAIEEASFTNPWTRDMLAWEIGHSDVSHFYVLRTGTDRVAAYCGFWVVFDELHINNLAVRPEHRGRGMGRTLLAHVLAEGRRLGARRATLEVRRSNQAALELYTSLGFRIAATRVGYYSSPREDALVLWHDALDHAAG